MLSTLKQPTCPKLSFLDADPEMGNVTKGNALEKKTARSGH